MQNFLFRKIEVWIALLVGLIGVLGAIGFGIATLDGERGTNRLGVAGRAALAISETPDTIRRLMRVNRSMATTKPDRFSDLPPGWSFPAGATRLPGYVLLSRHDGDAERHVVELVSLADGKVRHSWWPDAEKLLADAPRSSALADYTGWDNRHYRAIHPYLLDDGGLIIKDHQSYAMKVDACAGLVWRQDAMLVHHSTESDGQGGFWLPGLIEPSSVAETEPKFLEDALVHMAADGTLLSQESLVQIFLANGLEWALFNAGHRNSDPLHLNDIQPVLNDGPYWRAGDLFLSLRHLSMVLLYRPATHKIVWMKQGPWLAQHDVEILDASHIGIFDNHAYDRGTGARVLGANRVAIYDFATGQVNGPWDAALQKLEAHTLSEGLFHPIPGEAVMVEEENAGRLLFVDKAGNMIGQFVNTGSSGWAYRLGWSRYIDQEKGDAILGRLKNVACDA